MYDFVSCITAASKESATLYHCDLSYCQLDGAACAALGDGLRDNHSLYGLHMVGHSQKNPGFKACDLN